VFFRSRRHGSARDNPRAVDHSDAGIPEAALRQTQLLQEWRRSAQRVTRAWNSWLAAESRDRDVRYRSFVAALGDEERAAAEVEQMVALPDARECITTNDPRNSGHGQR
jgi:predicted dinucleotide-binding enzyme